MNEFEKSVQDIEGLTAFKLGTLPEWLSERLPDERDLAKEVGCSDAERVAGLHLEWLGEWGTATINGEEVFLFEFNWDRAYDQFEPARLADDLDCGLQEVEARGYSDATFVLTERDNLVPRRKSVNLALSASGG